MHQLLQLLQFLLQAILLSFLFFLGALFTISCIKITPCLGGGLPDFRWRNRAFSAPSNCMVPDGITASLSNPPAIATKRADILYPTIFVKFGAIVCIAFSIYSSRPSFDFSIDTTISANFFIELLSSLFISLPSKSNFKISSMLSNSLKNPYQSRNLSLNIFSTFIKSSNALTASLMRLSLLPSSSLIFLIAAFIHASFNFLFCQIFQFLRVFFLPQWAHIF